MESISNQNVQRCSDTHLGPSSYNFLNTPILKKKSFVPIDIKRKKLLNNKLDFTYIAFDSYTLAS